MLNPRLDYVIASGLFPPPLDMILHNAGYVYVFQVCNACEEEDSKGELMTLPGIGPRRQQTIERAVKEVNGA